VHTNGEKWRGVEESGGIMEVIGLVRISQNRVWLPKRVREKLGVQDGDFVYFYVNDREEVVIKKSAREKFSLI
jgi:AbrB family looped-hinge helix DNA binding protein